MRVPAAEPGQSISVPPKRQRSGGAGEDGMKNGRKFIFPRSIVII